MERLTAYNSENHKNVAYYPVCFEYPCNGFGCKIDGCKLDYEICQRLAAYEDTGLEPEDIIGLKNTCDQLHGINDSLFKANQEMGKDLAEWKKAYDEGRMVVLPCKVGDTVYRIYEDCELPGDCGTKMKCKGCEYRNLFIEEQAFCISMLSQNGTLGSPYYLTREDAEAALKGGEG